MFVYVVMLFTSKFFTGRFHPILRTIFTTRNPSVIAKNNRTCLSQSSEIWVNLFLGGLVVAVVLIMSFFFLKIPIVKKIVLVFESPLKHMDPKKYHLYNMKDFHIYSLNKYSIDIQNYKACTWYKLYYVHKQR